MRLFRFYAAFRRFLFYLGLSDAIAPWHSLFEEKNRAARENLIAYDSYYLSWFYEQAAPLQIPNWRPGFLRLYSQIFCLSGNLRSPALPSLVLLWLSSLIALLLKSLWLWFCLPFVVFFSALM